MNRDHLQEFFDAPETSISFIKALSDALGLRYSFMKEMATDRYHTIVVKNHLSRHIPELMPVIVDELTAAFNDELDVGDGFSAQFSPRLTW